MKATPPASQAPTELGAQEITELTVVVNEMAANHAHVNAYEIRNALLLERRKRRIRYEQGYTLPASAELLLANAEDAKYNHRRTLSRSIVNATQATRPSSVCAHHIVALTDREARRSRDRIFSWGIGINDADNGVFLPSDGVGMAGFPNAAHHTPHHNVTYHTRVWMRLARENDVAGGRTQLRSMKADLLAGTMTL